MVCLLGPYLANTVLPNSGVDVVRSITESMTGQEKRSFEALVRAGADRAALEWKIYVATHSPDRLIRYSLRTLRRFVQRVRGWAEEVERYNSDPALTPTVVAKVVAQRVTTKRQPDELAKRLSLVPGHIREYANCIEKWIDSVAKLPRSYSMQKLETIRLIEMARAATGKPHYRELADILLASYRAAGKRKKAPDEEDLRKLYKNNPLLVLLSQS